MSMGRTELLKKLINETGLSVKAFSQKADLPYSTLRSMLDRGIGNASVNNVIKVCKTLGITIEQLEKMAENNGVLPSDSKKQHSNQFDTIAAHLEDKNLTPQKIKLLEKYIDALFDDED